MLFPQAGVILKPTTCTPAFELVPEIVEDGTTSVVIDAATVVAPVLSPNLLPALAIEEAVAVADEDDVGADSELPCASTDSAADFATAAKGAAGMALPGGPTDTPRSRTSPFSISYTHPCMKTSARAPLA
jgi:hypothetical protein